MFGMLPRYRRPQVPPADMTFSQEEADQALPPADMVFTEQEAAQALAGAPPVPAPEPARPEFTALINDLAGSADPFGAPAPESPAPPQMAAMNLMRGSLSMPTPTETPVTDDDLNAAAMTDAMDQSRTLGLINNIGSTYRHLQQSAWGAPTDQAGEAARRRATMEPMQRQAALQDYAEKARQRRAAEQQATQARGDRQATSEAVRKYLMDRYGTDIGEGADPDIMAKVLQQAATTGRTEMNLEHQRGMQDDRQSFTGEQNQLTRENQLELARIRAAARRPRGGGGSGGGSGAQADMLKAQLLDQIENGDYTPEQISLARIAIADDDRVRLGQIIAQGGTVAAERGREAQAKRAALQEAYRQLMGIQELPRDSEGNIQGLGGGLTDRLAKVSPTSPFAGLAQGISNMLSDPTSQIARSRLERAIGPIRHAIRGANLTQLESVLTELESGRAFTADPAVLNDYITELQTGLETALESAGAPRRNPNARGGVGTPSTGTTQGQRQGAAPPAAGRTVVRRQRNRNTGQVRITYSDGTTEIQ